MAFLKRSSGRRSPLHRSVRILGIVALVVLALLVVSANWLREHQAQLQNVQRHEIVVLEGGHYLQWTQSRAMVDKITSFLAANLGRPGTQ